MTDSGMPKIGDVVADKYRLDAIAGEGGMGVVYAAEHLVLKQRVAVKVLLPVAAASDAVVERFAREARAAAKIDSEHVARVLDAGSTASGAPFLVMEYLEGCDLGDLIERHKTLPVADVVDYVVQALEGLAHAHAVNIVHRDLKPANLFLCSRPDGSNAIKVLDFGISKTTRGGSEDKRLTGQHVLGSPVYMSPEQLRNATDIDARADVWSMGVVAYELLSGEPPFDGDGVGEIFAAILEKEARPLFERNAAIPRELSDVIAKCLRRAPDERWQDVGQLSRALSPFGSGLTPLVERAEQVLARSKRLSSWKTPSEARRVVDAIEAAASHAITTGWSSGAAIPLVRAKMGTETIEDGVSTRFARFARFARHSPLRTLAVGLGLVATLTLGAVGVVRASRTSLADESAVRHWASLEGPSSEVPDESNLLGELPPTSTLASARSTPPHERASPEDTGDDEDPPIIMDLPATTSTERSRPRAAKPASTKPRRPKFLNSRE